MNDFMRPLLASARDFGRHGTIGRYHNRFHPSNRDRRPDRWGGCRLLRGNKMIFRQGAFTIEIVWQRCVGLDTEEHAMPDGVNVVVDISHHNGDVDFDALKSAGIAAVIHKATQGVSDVDPTYAAHRIAAGNAGLLWGAYHFGVDGDGVQQAIHFLDVVGDTTGLVIALDFETNPTGPTMSLEEARAFVTHVQSVTGRYPGLYSGHDIKQALGSGSDPVLANCWFWLAQYGPTAVVPQNWPTWTLWQYTDGALGPDPHDVPGVGLFDRDLFNGTADQLQAFWGS